MLLAWRLVPPRDAARLAIEAASAIDSAIAALEDALVESFVARDEAWILKRYLHRRDHIPRSSGRQMASPGSRTSPGRMLGSRKEERWRRAKRCVASGGRQPS